MAEQVIWKDKKRYLGLPISFTKYSISKTRLFIETGIFNLKEEEVQLYRIKDITLNRKLFQRLFGVGTIEVHSSDKTDSVVQIKNIKNPKTVKELLFKSMEDAKYSRRMRTTEIIGDDIEDYG